MLTRACHGHVSESFEAYHYPQPHVNPNYDTQKASRHQISIGSIRQPAIRGFRVQANLSLIASGLQIAVKVGSRA